TAHGAYLSGIEAADEAIALSPCAIGPRRNINPGLVILGRSHGSRSFYLATRICYDRGLSGRRWPVPEAAVRVRSVPWPRVLPGRVISNSLWFRAQSRFIRPRPARSAFRLPASTKRPETG